MMIYCALVFTIVSLLGADAAGYFKYEDCGSKNAILKVEQIQVLPDPVILTKNILANATFHFSQELPKNAKIQIKAYKLTSFLGIPLDIPIPCIGDVGSCTYDTCKFVKVYNPQICPFFPSGNNCTCPMEAGVYRGEDTTVPIPELGPIIRFLAAGRYRIELKATDKLSKKELGCIKLHVELKSK